jgi:hypothetical protein
MPSQSFIIGVAGVSIYQPITTSLPSASGVGFTVTTMAPTVSIPNDIRGPLISGTAYQVIWAFLGHDSVNNGYTVTAGSSASGAVTPSTGQGLLVNIPVGNFPAGSSNTPAIAIFTKAGNGNYNLNEFAYYNANSGYDFNHFLGYSPLFSAPGNFTASLLQSASSDPVLGSRSAVGWSKSTLSPTTGGVRVTREVTQVTVRPDTSADFPIATTRTAEITFQLLPNDIINVVEGNAGTYVQYTASNGFIYEEAQMSINTASALITGNNPMVLLMPPDNSGTQAVRLYLGQLLQNQTQNVENWTKTDTAPIGYTYSAVAIDTLTVSMPTEIQSKVIL